VRARTKTSTIPGATLVRRLSRIVAASCAISLATHDVFGQELEPGAYSLSPVGVNILVVANTTNHGDVAFDPSGPIQQAKATINTTGLGFVRTLSLAGRSATVGVAFPYTSGQLEGLYLGQFEEVWRVGFNDPRLRLGINVSGAPAMKLKEFASFQPKTTLGASLLVVVPLGENDPAKLINLSPNRWAFKPELGLSHYAKPWTFEAYAGVWLFADNSSFLVNKTRSQKPIGSAQLHLTYTIKPRMWLAFNVNGYAGGRTSVDGIENDDLQQNSRVGATFALPLSRRQSLKIGYSRGAIATIGGKFDAIALTYQFLWGGGL